MSAPKNTDKNSGAIVAVLHLAYPCKQILRWRRDVTFAQLLRELDLQEPG
jgi:hypothetical protein